MHLGISIRREIYNEYDTTVYVHCTRKAPVIKARIGFGPNKFSKQVNVQGSGRLFPSEITDDPRDFLSLLVTTTGSFAILE